MSMDNRRDVESACKDILWTPVDPIPRVFQSAQA